MDAPYAHTRRLGQPQDRIGGKDSLAGDSIDVAFLSYVTGLAAVIVAAVKYL